MSCGSNIAGGIVGRRSGIPAGTFSLFPGISRTVICEIEPLVPQKIVLFFASENHDILSDPRVEIVYDDARHYILTTREKFDTITSDPIHPWVKGSAALCSHDYFELRMPRSAATGNRGSSIRPAGSRRPSRPMTCTERWRRIGNSLRNCSWAPSR